MSDLPFDLTPDALRAQSGALRALSRALLGHEQDAEDAAQDTWLAALRSPPPDEAAGRSAWLARVARNFALRIRYKTHARRRWERGAARVEALPSTQDAVERVGLHRQILGAVLALDEPYRATVVLRFWEDHAPREVARLMGVPVATVRTRLRRALVILRGRLDREFGSRAGWSGLLALGADRAPDGGLALVTAARAALAGVMLMTTKAKFAAAIGGAVVLLWLGWSFALPARAGDAIADGGVEGVTLSIANSRPAANAPPVDVAAQRSLVDPAATTDPAAAAVEPWSVRVHVVDAVGGDVPGAVVEVWDPVELPPREWRNGKRSFSRERGGDAPILRRLTDHLGRCVVESEREMVWVHAAKGEVGESNDVSCWAGAPPRDGELLLALTAGVRVRGTVLRADGLPATAVEVRVKHVAATHESVRAPEPTKTDAEGRFEFDLRPGTGYDVIAEEGARSARATVVTVTPGDKEVVLRFAGAFSLRGLVLDPTGRPLPHAAVGIWETVDPKDRDPAVRLVIANEKTLDDGSFRLDVARPGRYRVLASCAQFVSSELGDVVLDEARPHADLVLRVLDATSIAGVVRRQDGTPIAGALVFLAAEQGEDPMLADRPTRHDLYGRVEPVRTDDAGAFRFPAVHPNATYRLSCSPDPQQIGIAVRRRGVGAGRQDVVLVLTDAEIRGSTITGTVVTDDTGQPVEGFRIRFIHYREDGTIRATSDASEAVIDAGRYTLPGLSYGIEYSFVIEPRDAAPRLVGPITTTGESVVADVRVESFGQVRCRVIDHLGNPVVNARVELRPAARGFEAGSGARSTTNGDGVLRADRLCRGQHDVLVLRDGEAVASQRVDVIPGRTTEVELRIPR